MSRVRGSSGIRTSNISRSIEKLIHRFPSAVRSRYFCFLHLLGLSRVPCNSHLPPGLPNRGRLAPPGHLVNRIPVTKYLGDGGKYRARVQLGIAEDVSAPGLPLWLSLFDWVVGEYFGFADTRKAPGSIFVYALNFEAFIRWIDAELTNGRVRIQDGCFLVVGTKSQPPSGYKTELIARAKEIFSRVYFSSNDGEDPEVRSYPLAMNDSYMRGFEKVLESLLETPPRKRNLVLAAWGAKFPSLNNAISDRRNAYRFVESNSFIVAKRLTTPDYYRELAESHYMIYPRGTEIQSPKGFEAWMLGTIPIVTSHPVFWEFKERGIPLLIVEEWADITEDLLWGALPALKTQMENFHRYTINPQLWWDLCFKSGY